MLLNRVRFWADISYRMLRLRTVLVMITFEAIGYEAVKPARSLSLDFFLAAVMLGILYMSATCFNDVADEEVDKINLSNDASRPLITTKTTAKQLKRLGVVSLVIASITAVLISPLYLGFVLVGAVLSILYSLPPIHISHRGILAALWLPLSYVVMPFFAGAFLPDGRLDNTGIYILIAMYICFIGRILLKDFRDYEGDKKFGKRNFLVRHGPMATCLASAAAWLAGDLVFASALYTKFPALVILAQPIVLGVLYGLYKLAKEKRYERKLLEVLFIGRLGNAIALALLGALTLQAFDYSQMQKNLIIIAIGVFMSVTAVGLWYDDSLRGELAAKQR